MTPIPPEKNMMAGQLLTYRPSQPGQLECTLDLSGLFATERERERFEARWPTFLDSDTNHPSLYRRKGNQLIYFTEHLIPAKTDSRPALLLVLGNPASHSVKEKMFFSFEADGREHRFWKNILRPAGILDLAGEENSSMESRNARRLERLLQLDYNSPFRIGLAVFISMPSAASGPWSGVMGIRKLLGSRAMQRLESAEVERILDCARSFLQSSGTVAVFQKNAWNNLRSGEDSLYALKKAKSGELVSILRNMPEIRLVGIPPTRLTGPARRAIGEQISGVRASVVS